MGMNHPPLYEDKDEKEVFKQAMMWLRFNELQLDRKDKDATLAHWLYHWCIERGKERFAEKEDTE